MSLAQSGQDALQYIDPKPSQDEIAAARARLQQELRATDASQLHSSVPSETYAPQFSDLLDESHRRITLKDSVPSISSNGIDLERYEEPSAPTDPSNTSAWKEKLRQAYTSQQYLSQRNTNLGLLERFGKNAWLISNSQVEDELRALEKELVDAQSEVRQVEEERRARQQNVKNDFEGIDESWRAALNRAIEAEVAVQRLKTDIEAARSTQAAA